MFVVLLVAERRGTRRRPGVVTGLFLVGYAVARIIGECFRQPDPQIGYLLLGTTEGQLLSIPVLIAGIVVILWARRAAAADRRRDRATRSPTRSPAASAPRGRSPLAAYMAMALHDPELGYYATPPAARRRRRFRHRARDQPDLRRADRVVVRIRLGSRSGGPIR